MSIRLAPYEDLAAKAVLVAGVAALVLAYYRDELDD